MTISVNLSPRQLEDPGLTERLAAALARNGADPSVLWVEVTEPCIVGGSAPALEAMVALRELGVRLAVDNFGPRGPPRCRACASCRSTC